MKARRVLAVAAAVAVSAATLSGCVTVHGETAVVPTIGRAEAARVLHDYGTTSNKANRTYDVKLNADVEAGALGAIDRAGLKSRKVVEPGGDSDYTPLRLTDPRFLIPKQAGWPKFFVADTRSNRTADGRWFLVFQRDSPAATWRATYLAVLEDGEIPQFARTRDGHVEAVPDGAAAKLVVSPDRISQAYVHYLGDGSGPFAPGPHTDQWRATRAREANRPNSRTEYDDQAAKPPQYTAFGLRTKDGGALVFFASYHQTEQTVARGHRPQGVDDAYVKALMRGTPKQSVTYVRVSEQTVTVPARRTGGKVAFLNRIDGLTSAKGE